VAGRHESSGVWARARRVGPGVAAVLAAAALVLGGVTIWRSGDDEPTTTTACRARVIVPVAVTPALAPVVKDVLAREGGAALGACATADVTAVAGAAVARADLSAASPALWVPDSSMWRDELAARDPEAVETRGSMASSPLVLAGAPATVARVTGTGAGTGAGAGPAAVPWRQLVASGQPLAVADPETTTEGAATLATLQTLAGARAGQPPPLPLVRTFVALSRTVVPTVDAAYRLTDGPAAGTRPLVATTEQTVVAHNRTAGGAAVVALYPSEGTTYLDYPVVRLRAPGQTPEVAEAASRLAAVLLGTPAARLAEAGFRGPDGRTPGSPGSEDGVRAEAPRRLPAPTAAVVDDALRTWSAVTLESRMLTVVDVSGSMAKDAGNGRTRIELARDAAQRALAIYPDSADIGLWAFSVRQTPRTDWVPLVDIGPLGEPVGAVSRRTALQRAAGAMPSRVKGGTGLYDTTLAAYRAVRSSYDGGRVNSVVLLTDGRNEDDPEGIDLRTLLRTLRAESDRAEPVPVITVGMGPDADMATLRQISGLTGGKAYQALDPRDIETVFLDAMVQRRCRPSCAP
jgi:hypothetical protein